MARLPGDGPWRVLDECPAPKHNTLRAREGRMGRAATRVPCCICPGAVELHRRDLQRRSRGQRRPKPITTARVGVTSKPGRPRVDLSGGTCQTPYGAALVRHYQETAGARQTNVRKAIRFMCRRCKVAEACRDYVETYEDPAGSWGGVWAGLTPHERRKRADDSKLTEDGGDSAPSASGGDAR